ncbi:T9SS type B sorting domain-containing protein [Flavobacterium sp. TP390]|uniref:T9SS type B sorting domain-containing protein n=1 Tax=Flavobacterium profundi TaxID=1774945 RepID=A0A6I4ISW5_9FLAO|nr:T9SS type B sorting domain-containing protein [Flavobacterium profundi]MVO09946.1 T9SS type B sorting domain-containing protein [Flavobacterium profundi]
MQFKTKTYYPLLFLYFLFIVSCRIEAQNETNNWLFGGNSGINFDQDVVSPINGSMNTPAGCSSISDENGDLLFYTNGHTIWNKNHLIMDNGDDLEGDLEGIQTSIIVPKPNDPTTYYVFYTREFNASTPRIYVRGIFYSEVKFSSQNPLGEVVIKNERIANTATARLAALYHYESNSYRLITLTNSDTPIYGTGGVRLDVAFRVFIISSNGINITPVVQSIDQEFVDFGAMKISPDGKYVAVADHTLKKVFFYEFDNLVVSFNHYFTLPTVPAFGLFISPYSIEFSKDSKNFYYSGGNYVVQFPFTQIGGMEPAESYIMDCPNAKSIQLARNGKIYIASDDTTNQNHFISVIHKPEKEGVACLYENNAINLGTGIAKKGLPIFVSSFLRNRIIASDTTCVNAAFNFSLDAYAPIESVQWDFADGNLSNDLEPEHVFLNSGSYKVKATITIQGSVRNLFKTIEVYPLPVLPMNTILTQCDTDNDGQSIFNLENIKDFLVRYTPEFQFYFYRSLDDATNDLNGIENYQNYINSSNLEEIFVKIISDKGCSGISSFFIENIQTAPQEIAPIYVCENSDNIDGNTQGKFDLVRKKQQIATELNLPANYSINFYASLIDAQTKLNGLDRYYLAASSTIWVRIEDDNFNCFGIITFQAIVNSEIVLNIDDEYIICESPTNALVLDGGVTNDTWQWKSGNGTVLSNDRFFEINQIGFYILEVTKEENGKTCTRSKDFRVLSTETPTIKTVEVDNGQLSVTMNGLGNFTYSVNGVDFYGNGTYHVFNNLEPDVYTLFIKDDKDCNTIIIENILILNYPAFFTPNQDGINDKWRIKGPLERLYTTAQVSIFDRYGKIIYSFDLLDSQSGWDGNYNNLPLPSSDYWYSLILISTEGIATQKRGHFTLKR